MIRGAAPSQNRLARSTAFKTNIYSISFFLLSECLCERYKLLQQAQPKEDNIDGDDDEDDDNNN